MKVLFVCVGNVARSQFAEEYFRDFSEGEHEVSSAGTYAGMYRGKSLRVYARKSVECMKEEGYDIANKVPRQLEEGMIDEADRVIVMAEKYFWPDYLREASRVEVWEVEDPGSREYEAYVEAREIIKERVSDLIKRLED